MCIHEILQNMEKEEHKKCAADISSNTKKITTCSEMLEQTRIDLLRASR